MFFLNKLEVKLLYHVKIRQKQRLINLLYRELMSASYKNKFYKSKQILRNNIHSTLTASTI